MEDTFNACMNDSECMGFINEKANILNAFYNYYANDSTLDAATIYAK